MYGTVARMKLRPGVTPKQFEQETQDAAGTPGLVSLAVYQAEADPQEIWMCVVFESKEAYVRNAESPEQDAEYQKMRALLQADPEWHDGTLVATHP